MLKSLALTRGWVLVVVFWFSGAAFAAPETPKPRETLVVGIFPRLDTAATYSLYKPLIQYLTGELGADVRLETSKSFREFWEAVKQRRYDIVHLNQYHYVKAHRLHGYDVFAMNEEFGRAHMTGIVAVSQDSPLRSVRELKGKTLIFGGDRSAMMSYIVPTALLRRHALAAGDYKETFTNNPTNAVVSVYHRRADAVGTGSGVLQFSQVIEKIGEGRMRALVESEPLAQLPWALKAEHRVRFLKPLQEAFKRFKDRPEGAATLKNAGLTGFVPARDSDYEAHLKLIREVLGEDYSR
jgi:phosphonate transport system substrate-binding protein